MKGLTLIEVIISLFLLTTGVVAIAIALSAGISSSSSAEKTDLALNILQARMEEIKDTEFGDLQDSGPAPDPDFSDFSVSVDVAEGENPMQIDATITWSQKGRQRSITLTTLAANF